MFLTSLINMVHFSKIFVTPQSTKIQIESNFKLVMYVLYVLKGFHFSNFISIFKLKLFHVQFSLSIFPSILNVYFLENVHVYTSLIHKSPSYRFLKLLFVKFPTKKKIIVNLKHDWHWVCLQGNPRICDFVTWLMAGQSELKPPHRRSTSWPQHTAWLPIDQSNTINHRISRLPQFR